MNNVLSRSKQLVSSIFKSGVLMEYTSVSKSVCSVTRSRCYSRFLARCGRENSSCLLWQQAITSSSGCHFAPKMFFSHQRGENSDSEQSVGVAEDESQQTEIQSSSEGFTLDVLVSLLRQENAVDICVIKVPKNITYAEYFIVVSGISPRHIRAMALYAIKVYKFLKKGDEPHVKIEGKDAEDWMCIDFGQMIVHFMLPETRDVYELEKLWTLRTYDEQLTNIPAETVPEDFIYDLDDPK
ncbi:mitochondrial assembly of ribosomal large subunit protein 1 isoform X2 [Thalassophryne amazonica]|uniref:mitochondrial assembly of ribosomal large subunit protein 1 isoform X2 n=1 Tax=Thalassophryne amazonica TaxID=390379 RepID=UPI0014724D04|nr:mitochondrial assembly of ribosomal large subunit protein 1 isoform X2 [Thalassophryne amazonica]